MKRLLAGIIGVWFVGSVNAATLTFEFNESFGSVPADPPAPWLTAVFTDAGAGIVRLDMDVANTIGNADITRIYFNLDPALNPNSLSFSRLGGDGPVAADTTITTGVNEFKAGGDGLYDIFFDFDTGGGHGSKAFNVGETLEYRITGIASLEALDFEFFSFPGGGHGPFLAAAKVQSTGPLECAHGNTCPPDELENLGSDWIAPGAVVPLPAAVWLFGSALGLLGWMRREAA